MAAGDYPGSVFYGAYSGNYTAARRPTSNKVDKIVIHVMQGSWSSAINWFKDSRSGVSCHYNVRSSDGKIGQSVREDDIAYHAGYWPYNQTSIGIEHEGYVSDPDRWFTDAMYRSSARLTAHLCRKYRIPANRHRIIGHNQVPGCPGGSGGGSRCHTDPGRYWNWTKYMGLVQAYLGYAQVVDNSTPGRFSANGGAWSMNTWNRRRYGASYRATPPRAREYQASFKVRVPVRDAYDVYAWWPADPGYNSRAVYRIYTVDGWRARAVDQRSNGGRWVRLGRYTMPAGDAWWVRVSSRSSGKGYIIADAVKIVRR
jgi:N-acetyl-anhydromuramyl-L-alanine amidase AmpD